MKLSIVAMVAAAVAAASMAFTAGAMAQGHSMGQIAGPNNFGPTNNPGVNTNMSQHNAPQQREGRQDAREQRQDRQGVVAQRQDRRALPSTGTHINPNGNASSKLFSPFSFLNHFGSRTGAREQRADRQQALRQREQRFQSKSSAVSTVRNFLSKMAHIPFL